ncbi:MAG: isoprenyl transferase [Fusobacteria bacterium]|nr:isoprenyl transferase [Fusobacteriota bacterium]
MKDTLNIPRHIGIIMDGNGRWAEKRGEIRANGHKAGMKSLRNIVEFTRELGVDYLTVYAFSTENWKRPATEVKFLMKLLELYIKNEVKYLKKNNIALRFLSRRSNLEPRLLKMIEQVEEETRKDSKMVLSIAFNYGGRQEISDGINKLLEDYDNGLVKKDQINEDNFQNYLYTSKMPDPELIIRTSGEFRTSNFLLWQGAYSEYYITDVLWPDFKNEDMLKAIESYNLRNRRFGGI